MQLRRYEDKSSEANRSYGKRSFASATNKTMPRGREIGQMMTDELRPSIKPRATIIIAEDDSATRMVLRQVLSREHFHVVAVENGKLALEAARRERPDLILLDWFMPVMDGRAALAELKANEATRGIPIVMLSSYDEVDERISALEAGVQDFLSKPFDPRELVACIEQQMRWRDRLANEAQGAYLVERDALRTANERRYRLLAEAMPHIVWVADARGEIHYFNRAWYTFTGRSESAGPTGWTSAIHPDDRAPSIQAFSTSLVTRTPYEMQLRLKRATDAAYRWQLVRAIPAFDDAGNPVEWVGSCSDIHDYRIASETRSILDAMGSIVAIRDDAGFIDYASPYWSQYTGCSVDAALGFGWRDFVHPTDLDTVERCRIELAAHGGSRQYESRIRSRDGIFRWFLTTTTMLCSPDKTRRWLDTSIDVDDLKRTQAALAASETRYRVLADSMPQMVWVTPDGINIDYVNDRWKGFTGLDLEQTRARGQAGCVHPDDRVAFDGIRTAPLDVDYTCEVRFRRVDGAYRWHTVRAVPFRETAGAQPKRIGTAMDVEEAKAAASTLATTAAELRHLAHHDALTNLPNRVLLVQRLAEAIALAQRAKTELIVLYMDLNRFKAINDTLGHAAGDRVLIVTAGRIAEALRTGDTASRVGGDEFVLVCASSEATEEAGRIAGRLFEAISAPIDIDTQEVTVGASIGISLYPADGSTGEELISRADSAMYAAKQSGCNAFQMYHAETHSSIVAALDFELELQAAVSAGQVVAYYQPVISLRTNRLIGAEALVRWQHPTRGLLAPAEFLPFAEGHRLGGDIGTIVLRAACAQIARLKALVSTDFQISINVSARQILEPGWVAQVSAAIQHFEIEATQLQIEIAENVVLNESGSVTVVLERLRALGVALSIDDFGTGYSSLASIKEFPLQSLKIDRSFVSGLLESSSDRAVAKTIITLAHSLGLSAVATGVESREQIAMLRSFGTDAFQGYLASRPMNSEAFIDYVDRYANLAVWESLDKTSATPDVR